jgi:hypothetical protein
MTLLRLAVSVKDDAERVRDRNRLVRDVQEYADLEADFNELRDQILEIIDSVKVLRAEGVEVAVERPPNTATASLRAIAPDGATIIDAPGGTAKAAVRDLKRWATLEARRVRDALQSWADDLLGDLDGAERFARQLGRLGVRDGLKIQGLVTRGRVLRNQVPSSPEVLDEVKNLASELSKATQAVAPSDETGRFLRAILQEGASLDLLTDDVRAWAVERGLWQSLRVRLSGDPGD